MSATSPRLSFAFRPMGLEDLKVVLEIDKLSFSMPWSERSYLFELTQNKHSITWVAETALPGGRSLVVGMIVIWVILDEAHIATIATHPDYRGQGIGRELLVHGLLAAYERGGRLAYLEVRRSNQVAQKLYEKFGFHVVGERLRYYKDNNEDALLMTLDTIRREDLLNLSEKPVE
jgi:[ribosomal protein S18]-alanine N-acetyltransferase